MDWLIQLFQTANALSPVGIIGLLIGLLYLNYVQKKKVDTIESNHLHEVSDHLYSISDTLQRMERNMETNFARILERLDR